MMELGDLQLAHWSTHPLGKLHNSMQDGDWHKPRGLWVSSEGNSDGWREWCHGEGFNLAHFAFRNEIRLRPKANILLISTAQGIRDFTEENAVRDDSMRFYARINWSDVTKRYAGIIIAPYQWDCRLDDRTSWYYSWDCASGCIWDVSVIGGIITAPAAKFQEAA